MPYKDPEIRKQKLKEWHEKHPGKHTEYQKRWDDKNREKVRKIRLKSSLAHYHRNRERICKERRERAQKDPMYYLRGHLAKFTLSVERYQQMVSEQGGLCGVCGKPETAVANGKVQRLSIDHDHRCCPRTDKCCGKCVRGLICSRCNVAMKLVELDHEWGNKASAYLKRFQGETP